MDFFCLADFCASKTILTTYRNFDFHFFKDNPAVVKNQGIYTVILVSSRFRSLGGILINRHMNRFCLPLDEKEKVCRQVAGDPIDNRRR
jgi:hypothetical protein